MPTAQQPPTQSEDSTRQRIIDAALSLFSRQGFMGTSTRAIAEAAGVNEVTLFRHFGNKRNLLMACTESFNAGGFAQNFEKQLAGDYAQDIHTMADMLYRDTANAFDMLRLLMCEASHVPELIEAAQMGMSGNTGQVTDWFQRQIDAGTLRPELDANALAFTFSALFSSSQIVPRMLGPEGQQELPPELLRQMADIFIQGTIRHE